MKKPIKLILILVIFGAGIFGLYWWRNNLLLTTRQNLFTERCSDINPLLVKTRQDYENISKMTLNENQAPEEFNKQYLDYIAAAEEYLTIEGRWVARQKTLMSQWDYRLLTDKTNQNRMNNLAYLISGYFDLETNNLDILNTKDVNQLDTATKQRESALTKLSTFEAAYYQSPFTDPPCMVNMGIPEEN